MIWTNLNTSVMSNYTVPQNTNSYIITGLSVNMNYNVSVAAIGVCGTMTSDPTTKCECVCILRNYLNMHVPIMLISYELNKNLQMVRK